MLKITVKLFGPQARLAGASEVAVEVPEPATCGALVERLRAAAPALAESLANSRLAVNHAFAADDEPVSAADEVALIGMVSGG